jgi:cobyrinic acid a,c-diamide synthase
MEFPRIIIAALRGGGGKTILSVGIIAALRKKGRSVAPFKKGPDYIDAGWLALAADRPCYNLDSFLLTPADNLRSFRSHSRDGDISVIEGNRGLYDGIDLEGSTSTAELAKLLAAPVVMCVDCTKITRTMAAILSGCARFDPDVMIKGVILNRVANARHEKKLRESIEHYCGMPILGAIPKLSRPHFPERHLGLVPAAEHEWANASIQAIAEIVEQHLDLEAITAIADQAPELKIEVKSKTSASGGRKATCEVRPSACSGQRQSRDRKAEIKAATAAPKIGIIKDAAFQFYYPENIEALICAGAEVVFLSPLIHQGLPDVDALYIGGGFPETHAAQLAENTGFGRQLKTLVEDGLPVYAECGGLMYLGEELILEGKSFPMVGILPVVFDFFKRPQGHGYTLVTVERENPYYSVGIEIKGHEFHYSRVSKWAGDTNDLVFRMNRGVGIEKDKDGIVYKNVLATYMHIHALGTPQWARALVRNAINFKKSPK